MSTSKMEINHLLDSHPMVLLYFGGKTCGVCQALKPKVKDLLGQFSNIQFVEIEIDQAIELSAQFNVFTIPVIILYIEGKEVIRMSRHISLMDLESKLARYYHMLF